MYTLFSIAIYTVQYNMKNIMLNDNTIQNNNNNSN